MAKLISSKKPKPSSKSSPTTTNYLPGSSRPVWPFSSWNFCCGTLYLGGCRDLRKFKHALAPAGNPTSAARLLLVGLAAAAGIDDPIHPGTSAAQPNCGPLYASSSA